MAVVDGFGSTETGVTGMSTGDGPEGRAGTGFTMDERMAVLDDDLQPVDPGSGAVGRLARRGRIPIGYYNDPEKTAETFVEKDGVRWVLPGDLRERGRGRRGRAARPRIDQHQHRRREGLPGRGRVSAARAPRRRATSWSSGCRTSAGATGSSPCVASAMARELTLEDAEGLRAQPARGLQAAA